METAREKATGEIVEAEALWQLQNVNPRGYECWGCGIELFPASYQPHNKKRPYFSVYQHVSHKPGCNADAEEKLVSAGKKKSVRKQLEKLPHASPSALVLINQRIRVASANGAMGIQPRASASQVQATTGQLAASRSRRPANTIRPVCRAFINFPKDRDMSLALPGLQAQPYSKAFKKLSSICAFSTPKIFYSSPQWKKIDRASNVLVVPLVAGIWKDSKPFRNYEVHVHWDSWVQRTKTLIANEIEAVREDDKRARKTQQPGRAYIFFLGSQDNNDLRIFHIYDHRLICSLFADITF